MPSTFCLTMLAFAAFFLPVGVLSHLAAFVRVTIRASILDNSALDRRRGRSVVGFSRWTGRVCLALRLGCTLQFSIPLEKPGTLGSGSIVEAGCLEGTVDGCDHLVYDPDLSCYRVFEAAANGGLHFFGCYHAKSVPKIFE